MPPATVRRCDHPVKLRILGYAVAQSAEALGYKPEGRGSWNFPLTLSFRPYYGPGVDSTSNIAWG